MTETLAVNVLVAPLNTEHCFIVPGNMAVGIAVELMIQILSDEYLGINPVSPGKSRLVLRNSGKVLDYACSFKQLSITQGESLVLV